MPLMDPPDSPASTQFNNSNTERHLNYKICPATIEDVRRLVDIEFHAFENERTNHVLSYRDHGNPDHLERTVQLYKQYMKAQPKPGTRRRSDSRLDPPPEAELKFLKVVDQESGEIVSFAKTETKAYTATELASPADIGHEHEPRMNREWFALNERIRREYVGLRKHCYVGMLATEPRFQHHGAGTMLLEAVLAEADASGIESYLEGTQTAKPLYLKYGFKPINEIYFDPALYSVRGLDIEHQTVLARDVKPAWDAQTRSEMQYVS